MSHNTFTLLLPLKKILNSIFPNRGARIFRGNRQYFSLPFYSPVSLMNSRGCIPVLALLLSGCALKPWMPPDSKDTARIRFVTMHGYSGGITNIGTRSSSCAYKQISSLAPQSVLELNPKLNAAPYYGVQSIDIPDDGKFSRYKNNSQVTEILIKGRDRFTGEFHGGFGSRRTDYYCIVQFGFMPLPNKDYEAIYHWVDRQCYVEIFMLSTTSGGSINRTPIPPLEKYDCMGSK